MSGVNFYKDLKSLKLPLASAFEARYFCNIPPDWSIIIADVKNSTAAVNSGRHNDVNLVAAGSLIAGLNIARDYNIEIPFFFGGDGGTFLVPEEILTDVLAALVLHNQNTQKNFGLEMHIGHLSVKEIWDAGHTIKIAKLDIGSGFTKALILGDGFRIAENIIKHSAKEATVEPVDSELNLNGLECRWDKIKPPVEENEIVCYLVETMDPSKQIEVYRNVLMKIDEIYGNMEKRHPLSLDRLKLLLKYDKIKKEMLAKFGKWNINYFISTFLKTFVGRYWLRYDLKIMKISGRKYLAELIANAETLTIDGRINTIITGKRDKRVQLLEYLAAEEKLGNLVYGHHISKESIMTCYIESRDARHIHFVDGAEGGFTEAAKELKSKLAR